MICITIISLPETKDKVFSLIYIFCAWAVYVQSWVDQLINQSEQQKIKQSGHLAQNLLRGMRLKPNITVLGSVSSSGF